MEIDGAKLGPQPRRRRRSGSHRALPLAARRVREGGARGRRRARRLHAGGAAVREVAAEKGSEAELRFTNIRETAGWCEHKSAALPKMAALLAEAAYRAEPATLLTLKSDGVCLVYGAGQQRSRSRATSPAA